MPKDPDNFKEKWESLTEQERQFVLVADEFDRRLPHNDGGDKIIPAIGWQDVALRSGVQLADVERLVMKLAEMHFVMILNPERQTMGALCGGHLRHMEWDHQRRIRNWIDLVTALVMVGIALVWLLWTVRK